jgi:aldose 1-epimerase
MISEQPFGDAKLFTLQNSNGMEARITNYGGIVTSLLVPTSSGKKIDVALGFSTLDDYIQFNHDPFFGALIGRFGNRIDEGKLTLDGVTYSLAINNPPNHLHGGPQGFDRVFWTPAISEEKGVPTLTLSYLSRDGEENYPGNLQVTVTYRLLESNTLEIDYFAETDKATPINLTNHTYFNLEGDGNPSILDHQIQIFADRYTPIHPTMIPTGSIDSVHGTPFDFLQPKVMGAEIDSDHPQIQNGLGYDHNFILTQEKDSTGLFKVAKVTAPRSGITLEAWTTEPAVQFYTGNFLYKTVTGKQGKPYPLRSGFCLETQHYPDSPNQPQFPNTILRPGETFRSTTQYRLSS